MSLRSVRRLRCILPACRNRRLVIRRLRRRGRHGRNAGRGRACIPGHPCFVRGRCHACRRGADMFRCQEFYRRCHPSASFSRRPGLHRRRSPAAGLVGAGGARPSLGRTAGVHPGMASLPAGHARSAPPYFLPSSGSEGIDMKMPFSQSSSLSSDSSTGTNVVSKSTPTWNISRISWSDSS